MKGFRRLGVFLLILYAAVILAAGLHIHSGKDQGALHCQLCQVSNLSLTQTVAPHCSPGLIPLGILGESHKTLTARETLTASFGRAPPLS
jgi:hypothetical protein